MELGNARLMTATSSSAQRSAAGNRRLELGGIMPTTKLNAIMTFVKETPGTALFAEDKRRDGRKPRNVYLPKADWDELGRPASITVTYEVML